MSARREQPSISMRPGDYIRDNFEPSDRIALLMLNRKTGESTQRITSAEKASSPEFQGWLRYRNASGDEIYVGMNPLKPEASTRTKDQVSTIRHAYLDIDRNGPIALERIANSGLVPQPNYILESSPEKYQVVWKVEGIAQDQAEALQRAMVREFGGDPAATDSTRVLRLPGFVNHKYETEHLVTARSGASQTYHIEDFKLRTDVHEDYPTYLPRELRAGSRSGELSQSERDWAFAKRALARGDDPETVIQRIADYRADDKSRPDYYARHTVEKAQAALHRQAAERPQSNSETTPIRLDH